MESTLELKTLSRKLLEDLHEPFTNESRLAIIEEALQKAFDLGGSDYVKPPTVNNAVPHE